MVTAARPAESEAALDDVDLDIIAALQLDPRAAFDRVAEVLGTTGRTVARRVDRMTEAGVLRFVCEVHRSLVSEGTRVHSWIRTEPRLIHQVAETLTAMPEVVFCCTTADSAGVYCTAVPGRGERAAFLTSRLPAVPGILATRSEIELRVVRKASSWRLPRLTAGQRAALARPVPDFAQRARPLSEEERTAVALLRDDARLAYADLARALGMTQPRARRLVLNLLDEGLLQPRVDVEPGALGYRTEAIIGLRTQFGHATAVAEALTRYGGTRYLARVAGTSSLLCQAVFQDELALADFLDDQLSGVDAVVHAEVSMILKVAKRLWIPRDGVLLGTPRFPDLLPAPQP
ncbi:Lrp/AsnC family transcriptional regulator [Saccharothrix obliqua]|uniref:Lrp/AsnC family transcriptional regulator n=1 Tax=Saccharothrix obliqua TaxID=2861747 RepID=UPI001C5E3E46|nr:Lrp/AsnC family transcriptional regulator [Saccharothrix obliqua]MBW4717138.1 Lrp/AsnC family transcriptional regulator [Saccharothrix obliqua]